METPSPASHQKKARRLRFPSYAPRLDPDERDLKQELASGLADTLDELIETLCKPATQARKRQDFMVSFLTASQLPFFFALRMSITYAHTTAPKITLSSSAFSVPRSSPGSAPVARDGKTSIVFKKAPRRRLSIAHCSRLVYIRLLRRT
jgi:hypothetical protein